MRTGENIYKCYQEEIVPLMAEMYAYIEKDYRGHNKDVADLYKIIAKTGLSGNLSPEDKEQAIWLITKIKIAAYSFIVKEIEGKLNDFDKRCDQKQRDFAGIEARYNALKYKIKNNQRALRKKFGRYPKICEECMSMYGDTYHACIEILGLIGSVMTKSTWLYPYSPFNVFKKPLTWLVSLAISVIVGYFVNKHAPNFVEYIKCCLVSKIT